MWLSAWPRSPPGPPPPLPGLLSVAHFPPSPQTRCFPGDEGIMSRLPSGGEKVRGQTDTDGDRGRGCGTTQLSPIPRCQLTTVGHGHSRDLKPATEASQEELKLRGAEEELTGHSATGVGVKSERLQRLGCHSVSDPTMHHPLGLSRGGRQLNDSAGISPTKSNPSPVEVPRGREVALQVSRPSSPGAEWQLGFDGWTPPPRD